MQFDLQKPAADLQAIVDRALSLSGYSTFLQEVRVL